MSGGESDKCYQLEGSDGLATADRQVPAVDMLAFTSSCKSRYGDSGSFERFGFASFRQLVSARPMT